MYNKRSLRKSWFVLALAAILALPVSAQRKPVKAPVTSDTSANHGKAAQPTAPKKGPKPYKDVISAKAMTHNGLFKVHEVDDKWYFEIGDSMLNRDILVVNRISKAPADTRAGFVGYAGDEINQNVIRFEKGPNDKIFLRNISFTVYAKDSTKPMYKSVENSNVQPIAAAFDIAAYSPDSSGSVIDMTSYINSDNDILYFASYFKRALRLGNIQSDKSYIVDVKSFPINTEIRTVKTYAKTPPPSTMPGMPSAGPQGNATFELNSSLVLLPKQPMRPRYYDDRVAYFTTEFTDFDADPQGVKDVSLITRWRLEPKPEDMDKFLRGELVEPKKPIIYYIDPATPEKWIPYLIQGVNDWQKAFEKAGFKNAIIAKRAPTKEEDSTWSLEDARYSAIVYKPSDIPNASGPHVHDPRSGEIIESHINWYHNVMKLVRDWYLIQASPSDPRARKFHFDDELMGQLIRFVSSHEVGHTLGLPHNMGSSSSVPVEKLRDKAWVEAHGHTPSIMDYARFNYVAQPGDNISEAGLFPRIGDYDMWSIEWGYKPIPGKTPEEERAILNEWVKARYNNDRLRFLHADGIDPRAQTESLGDDNMKASDYGIKNLQWILPRVEGWVNEKGENYDNLQEIYGEIVNQFSRYMGHVTMNVGGIYTDLKTTDQSGQVFTVVPKTVQKEAMSFLNRQLFQTPTWLLNKSILDKISSPTSDRISQVQDSYLGSLLSTSRMQRLISSANRDASAYKLDEFMDDLKKSIWTELPSRKPIDNYRRNLQKSFVDRLGKLIEPQEGGDARSNGGRIVISMGANVNPQNTDIVSVAKGTLRQLKAEINAAIPAYSDKMSKMHLQDLSERISQILNPR